MTTLAAAAARAKTRLGSLTATVATVIIAAVWTIPTFGLLLSSFRPEAQIKSTGWWTFFTDPRLTLDNYTQVLSGDSAGLGSIFVNSVVIAVPAVIMPILLAVLAAYAFAWIRFPGRDLLFLAVFAVQIVPVQVALIPLLKLFVSLHVAGTFWTLWIAHTTFALPLAIYLIHNFIAKLPAELIEAARVDGATHAAIIWRIVIPLSMPGIAAFGVFQFLWVWNDLLVSLAFAGGAPQIAPLTVRLAQLAGTNGTQWQLLSAGAFIAIAVPLVVFIALQRYFVRGLLTGSSKS
ncbi:carbohydrate ABC transporter permease [Phytohabitans sp. ZYX-F-186]|uniref:Carbohydrate ABC transporter permease n=1 Tax=Phytohabitans maris TaxID=3071409 RepID=A0ABU0ZMB6_9ACTN|nr:carbohydrate ABC transporter permease [Phytohabitans sp. ZYX-F-186]MDQ7907539.1 carbohydrate ABC transporter permease [Phytohabitans sp. ZYX-F-186]